MSGSGKATFDSKENQDVSERIKEKQLQASHEGEFNHVRENDIRTPALGNSEHPGQVRGNSSYEGWLHGWPEDRGIYKKRKGECMDVNQLAQRIRT